MNRIYPLLQVSHCGWAVGLDFSNWLSHILDGERDIKNSSLKGKRPFLLLSLSPRSHCTPNASQISSPPACQICVNSKLKVAIRICDLAILMDISRTCRFVSHPIRSVIYKVCMYVYECFLVIMPNQLVDSAKEKFLMWYPPSSLEFGRLIQPITELMWYPVFCRGWERPQCPPVRRTFF